MSFFPLPPPSIYIRWRRKWQPSPVLLPEEFHGQRSLASCSPWDHRGLDSTMRLSFTPSIRTLVLLSWCTSIFSFDSHDVFLVYLSILNLLFLDSQLSGTPFPPLCGIISHSKLSSILYSLDHPV